jgi:peptidoglycan/xylan/chitin deacetylase (PgdA/CDA1 family)
MYHYINDEEPHKSRLGVSPKSFERQMRFLKEHNYNVTPLAELVGLIKYKKKIPHKTVAITFDDGYLDNYTNGFPILKKYNLPATFFVVINRIGKRLGNDEYMNWQQIKELANSGLITIGSQSMNHPNLSEIDSREELGYEIFESKKILEGALQKKVNFFSYPFGGINLAARDLAVEAGYEACLGTNFPRGRPADDIYALKRLRISENAKNLFIFWVETSGFYTYIKEQRDD